jgi:glycine dehydrogenase
MDIATASLLDEATGAAEAVMMAYAHHDYKRKKFFVSSSTFPQTIDVIKTRCEGLGITLEVGNTSSFDLSKGNEYCGVLI